MGHLFIGAMLLCAVISLFVPWIGVAYGYLFVILTPQAVWFWDFTGWRPVLWVLLPTCIGVVLGLLRQQFDLATLRTPRTLFFLVLWVCFVVSYYFGPYTEVTSPYRFDDPATALDRLNKILLLYFFACLCIDSELKLRAVFLVVVGSATFLAYWASMQYLTGHYLGRLAGPVDAAGGGIYADENTFAMLFVVSQSFLWYLGESSRRKLLRWSCWLVIPFCWHAVFLTGSRGGLVGLGVTTALMGLRSKRKLLGLALIPALAIVFIWQGGSVMKNRFETIDQYQTEGSAESRLDSWQAALKMIADHPVTGVGLASFGPAFPDYSDKKPRQAHDTLLQIAAESGVMAGIMYILVLLTSIIPLWRNGNEMRKRGDGQGVLFMVNEATLVALCGFAVCGIFLSLHEYEIFYCLAVLANAVLYLSRKSSVARGAVAVIVAAPPLKEGGTIKGQPAGLS